MTASPLPQLRRAGASLDRLPAPTIATCRGVAPDASLEFGSAPCSSWRRRSPSASPASHATWAAIHPSCVSSLVIGGGGRVFLLLSPGRGGGGGGGPDQRLDDCPRLPPPPPPPASEPTASSSSSSSLSLSSFVATRTTRPLPPSPLVMIIRPPFPWNGRGMAFGTRSAEWEIIIF